MTVHLETFIENADLLLVEILGSLGCSSILFKNDTSMFHML